MKTTKGHSITNYTPIRLLIKTIEFLLLLIITLFVSPLVLLVWMLDIAEKVKQGNRKRLWPQRMRKGFYGHHDKHNNAVMQG